MFYILFFLKGKHKLDEFILQFVLESTHGSFI